MTNEDATVKMGEPGRLTLKWPGIADQIVKTKPPAGSCSRFLDQSLGPTRARSSRNRPLERPGVMPDCSRVGWTFLPLTLAAAHFASNIGAGC